LSRATRASDRPVGRNLRPLSGLIPFLRPYLPAIFGALIALMVAAGTVLWLGSGLRILIDQGFGAGGSSELLDQAAIVLLGLVALMAVASYARFYLVSWIGERVVADLRRAIFDHIIRLDPGFFEVTRTGEVLTRLTTDTTLIQAVVGSSASFALRHLLMFIGGATMLALTSPKLTGMVFLVVPFVLVPILVFGRRVRRLSRTTQDRIADVGAYVDESLNAIRTVQAFGHEEIDRSRFAARVTDTLNAALAHVRARAWLTALVIAFAFGSISVVLWVGGHDVIAGRISPGELSAFVFYAVVVAGAVAALSEIFGDLQRAAGATERLMDLLATQPVIAAPAAPVLLPQPARGALQFERVSFRYPARLDMPALDDFSLSVAHGERVALVGPSGAGKTTVFQLALRFYDPASGTIRFDGVDIKRVAPSELRRRIGLVPQEPVIFSADAWENIRYGRPEASDAEVRAAAEAAAAMEFIDRLPQGFATFLGEKGVRLSGGQRQRIAIARAILRNPALLLLDEATSALDAESERLVQQALERLMAGRTTIVIAHRLATVQQADRIVVVDQGRIVAQGSHAELMRAGGLYARLAQLQFDQADDSRRAGGALSSPAA